MQFDTLVHGGRVVAPGEVVEADVGIVGERIVAVEPGLAARCIGTPASALRRIDAAGHLVLPGVVDAHVHLDLPVAGTTTADDYASGTRAAARGGVTTVIDFATPYGQETMSEALDNWFRRAEGKAMVDYAFHATPTDWRRHGPEIASLVARGIPTFKAYMVYPGLRLDDDAIFSCLKAMRRHGGRLLVHAESPERLDPLVAQRHNPRDIALHGIRLHPMTRPALVETEAVARMLALCERARGHLYLVHLSSGESVDLVRAARARGVPVAAETCAHYLALDNTVFDRPDGHCYATCPPVRTVADRERLWRGVIEGDVATVATDTCSFTPTQKDAWDGDWTRLPMGLPGLETLLPVVYTFGTLERGMALTDLCARLSEGPARLMGLWPRKGAVRPGFDADLAIVHPEERRAVRGEAMESRAGWSPFEGLELAGFPRTVLSRGEVVVEDYAVISKPGRGRWVFRRLEGEDQGRK